MQQIRIASIEDDKLIQESLVFFIKNYTHYSVVATSNSLEAFLKLNFSDPPNIILLDIGLPGISGHDGISMIKDKYSNVEIVMLTSYEDEDYIFKALSLGACSYISKRTPMMKIVDALHVVVNGGSYMSPDIAKKVISYFSSTKKKNTNPLTSRQMEIVKYVVDGLTYDEIAKACFISINTVRSHIRQIYGKLEIDGKADLVRKYLKGEI